MKKYDRALIKAYIEGEDIGDYNIEELENDPVFMKEVIKVSKDKNMYFLCGDNVKKNYDFIKFLIETYKDDIKFICDVADDYLNDNNQKHKLYPKENKQPEIDEVDVEDIKRDEIIFLTRKLTAHVNEEDKRIKLCEKYRVRAYQDIFN